MRLGRFGLLHRQAASAGGRHAGHRGAAAAHRVARRYEGFPALTGHAASHQPAPQAQRSAGAHGLSVLRQRIRRHAGQHLRETTPQEGAGEGGYWVRLLKL